MAHGITKTDTEDLGAGYKNPPRIERVYLAPGTRVEYSYEHSLNGRSRSWITKSGIVLGQVAHRGKYVRKPESRVQLDGNKTVSVIETDKLVIAKEQTS